MSALWRTSYPRVQNPKQCSRRDHHELTGGRYEQRDGLGNPFCLTLTLSLMMTSSHLLTLNVYGHLFYQKLNTLLISLIRMTMRMILSIVLKIILSNASILYYFHIATLIILIIIRLDNGIISLVFHQYFIINHYLYFQSDSACNQTLLLECHNISMKRISLIRLIVRMM